MCAWKRERERVSDGCDSKNEYIFWLKRKIFRHFTIFSIIDNVAAIFSMYTLLCILVMPHTCIGIWIFFWLLSGPISSTKFGAIFRQTKLHCCIVSMPLAIRMLMECACVLLVWLGQAKRPTKFYAMCTCWWSNGAKFVFRFIVV